MMIGSHSHRFSAICGTSGQKLWETTLPDRIESSACLSLCSQFVIVGKLHTLLIFYFFLCHFTHLFKCLKVKNQNFLSKDFKLSTHFIHYCVF